MVTLYTSQLACTVVSISGVSVLLAVVSNTFPFIHTDLFSSQLCLWPRQNRQAKLEHYHWASDIRQGSSFQPTDTKSDFGGEIQYMA